VDIVSFFLLFPSSHYVFFHIEQLEYLLLEIYVSLCVHVVDYGGNAAPFCYIIIPGYKQ